MRALCNDPDMEAFTLVIRAWFVYVILVELDLPFCAGENSCDGEGVVEGWAFDNAKVISG